MSLVFFTDRDLGKRFPEILLAAGLTVEPYHTRFRHDTPDEVWLEYVGERGRIAVTHDRRIRYKPNELAAVVRHGVALIVVIGKVPVPELARSFVNTVEQISDFVANHERPFIAKVHRPSASELANRPGAPGSVVLWYPPQ